jgi:hypothetical protein
MSWNEAVSGSFNALVLGTEIDLPAVRLYQRSARFC